MRGNPLEFDFELVDSLRSAFFHLGAGARPFAGGTDLMVELEAGRLHRGKFVDLSRLRELKGVRLTEKGWDIGALVTYSQVLEHRELVKSLPLLGRAARATGSKAIQNRGTLGGNIANASPAADSPPVLLVYDAQLELLSRSAKRTVSYSQFHTDYKVTALTPGEIISRIRVPLPLRGTRHYYRKVGTRNAQAISKIVMAGISRRTSKGRIEIRVAVGSVAPIPKRLTAIETLVCQEGLTPAVIRKAREILLTEISPIDDIRSSRIYRLAVAQNCLTEFLEELL